MTIDVSLTNSESELLDNAVALLKRATRTLTRARLEVGRAMCDVIASRRDRGHSSRATRILLADYMRRATGDVVEVARLVNVYQTVLLLGDGDAGELMWSSLFRMYHLIQQRDDQWCIRSGYEFSARKLFAKARAECWSSNTTAVAVGKLVGKPVQVTTGSVKRVTAGSSSSGQCRVKASSSAGSGVKLDNSDPRDMADHIIGLITKHYNTKRVVEVLMANHKFNELLRPYVEESSRA